jgi:hypothetical protein
MKKTYKEFIDSINETVADSENLDIVLRDGTVISYPMAELEIDEYDDLTDDSYRKVYEAYLRQEDEE